MRNSDVTSQWSIRKTCPCNEYPLLPHFYIVKLEYTGVYLFFLFLLQNIDCGYSLEPPRWGSSNVYPQSMFWGKLLKNQNFSNEIFSVFFWKLCNYLFIAWTSFCNAMMSTDSSQKHSYTTQILWFEHWFCCMKTASISTDYGFKQLYTYSFIMYVWKNPRNLHINVL